MPRTPELTDLQLVLLSHAARNEGGQVFPLPPVAADRGRALRELKALLRCGLLTEVETTRTAHSWREEGNIHYGLIITGPGKAAIGLEGDDTAESVPAAANIAVPGESAAGDSFIATCALARHAFTAPEQAVEGVSRAQAWERGLTPETTGTFSVAARKAGTGVRIHADVWHALSNELSDRGIRHSNDRVFRYGPDLFTYGQQADILFEIKSATTAGDISQGVGQLLIYERLLGARYRKILVLPQGARELLKPVLKALGVDVLEYTLAGRRIAFVPSQLREYLGK